jgi:hypothetical protein
LAPSLRLHRGEVAGLMLRFALCKIEPVLPFSTGLLGVHAEGMLQDAEMLSHTASRPKNVTLPLVFTTLWGHNKNS